MSACSEYKEKYLLLKQMGGHQYTFSLCTNIKPHDKENTLFLTALKRMFKEHNFKEIPQDDLLKYKNIVDVLFMYDTSGKVVSNYYSVQCKIKNALDGVMIVGDKCHLHYLITNSNIPELISHIPKTLDLDDVHKLEKNQILILRPCAGWANSGRGIVRVTTNERLQAEKRNYQLAKKRDKRLHIIASEYITKPLLFDGYKCHFRMFMLVVIHPKPKKYFFKIGKIRTASKKYINENFDDIEIHDTHMHSTKHDYFFPKDCDKLNMPGDLDKNVQHILDQMKFISDHIYNFVKPHLKPFPESQTGYNVFGLDFMIDTSLNVFLIECNERPGYQNIDEVSPGFVYFSDEYFKWIYKHAIKKTLQSL
jgi:hypothetical protein